MKNDTQKHNWLLDAILFAAFMLTFFLDLTGVPLHQWLGMAAGALALYHLARHWEWVVAVGQHLSQRLKNRSGWYLLLDGALMFGLASILASGLLISTWLNLAWINLDVVWTYHVIFALLSLALLLLKIGLHARWIVKVARERVFAPPQPRTAILSPARVAPSLENARGRREFLKLMSAVGVVSLVALSRGAASLVAAQNAQESASASDAEATATTQASATTSTQAQATATATSTAVPTATGQVATQESAQSSSAAVQSCVLRCGKGCSYPGRCRRYSDTNGNGLCDQGECA